MIIDKYGKWRVEGNVRYLVEPSELALGELKESINLNPTIVEEEVDEEKVAMAEAIINLTMELEEIKTQIGGTM